MIIYMLVMVRVYPYPILAIQSYVPLNAPLHYLTFSMFLTLPNHCYLFRNFIVIIMFILNFTLYVLCKGSLTTKAVLISGQSNYGLYVLSKSSAATIPQAYWSPCVSATTDLWHRQLGHPTSRIFNVLVFKNKIMCTSRRSLVQCQACPLSKSSRLSLQPTGHKTIAPLDLIFSYELCLEPYFYVFF